MISSLRGFLIEKQAPSLVIDVQGVGYEILAPMSTFYNLPDINTEVSLLTHFSVREDAHVLYGFLTESERSLFRDLIRVSGVGPKLSLSIISSMELAMFAQCINQNDIKRLIKIPGVGKKMAERLVVEMRDRLSSVKTTSTTSPVTKVIATPVEDAISALIALGYKPADARRWVQAVAEDGLTSEILIRRALQSAL